MSKFASVGFAVLITFIAPSSASTQELTSSSVTLPGFRVEGKAIGQIAEIEYDNTCADACTIRNLSKDDCRAAQPDETGQGCRLYGSGFKLVADPQGRASILTKVDFASLRHDRAAELAFLHPDIIARADGYWINLPVADGMVEDVMPEVMAAAREGDLAALEYHAALAASLGQRQAYAWWEAAKAMTAATAVAEIEDPIARSGYHELAVSLATNAYLVAQIPEERTIALAHLADALAAAGDPASAAAVGRYRLGLADDPSFEASVESWETAARDQAPAPRAGAPVMRTIGSWDVICDNVLSCVATTMSPVEKYPLARIDLTRDAGPAAAPHIAFRLWGENLSNHIMNGPQENFFFDGSQESNELLAGLSYQPGNDDRTFNAPAARVAPIMTAIAASDEVFVRSPRDNSLLTSFPVGGFSEVLAFFDEVQQRKGSETALAERGPAGMISVPPPPPLPHVEAAMVEGEPIADAPPTAIVDAWKEACDEWDIAVEHGAPDATGYRLGDGLDFWTMACVMSPYNTGKLGFFQKDGEVRPALFGGPQEAPVARSDGMIWNPTIGRRINALSIEPVDETVPGLKPFVIYSNNLGRDFGDCGVNSTYVFDGTDFRLYDQSRMDRCAGWNWLWSMVWRSSELADRGNESRSEAEAAEMIETDGSGEAADSGQPAEIQHLSAIRISGAYQSCTHEADSEGDAFAIACSAAETRRFDVRLNAAYKAVMGQLADTLKAKLKLAQRDWLKSRDLTCALPAALAADNAMDASTGKVRSAGCLAYETGLRVEYLERLAAISSDAGPDDRNTSLLIESGYPNGYLDCLDGAAGNAAADRCADPVKAEAEQALASGRGHLEAVMRKAGKSALAAAEGQWTKATAASCAVEGAILSDGAADSVSRLSDHCLIRETLIRAERLEDLGLGYD